VSTERGRRIARLEAARLYFICDSRPGGRRLEDVLGPALGAGVDVFQLRDKRLGDEELLEVARAARRLCDEHQALLILNDRPELAVAADADGVHVGQDDMLVSEARAIVGADRIVGLSTHTPAQVDAARGVDYIGVGPVYETPTKSGRRAVGTELVRHAAAHARVPFFAIGGIGPTNIAPVLAAGAGSVAVVRAIADAADPAAAAAELRSALPAAREAGVGAA
jgi:thiamine-phosphate pyrophosphorylase